MRLWKLDGEYYELEGFAAKHPGGAKEVLSGIVRNISLGRGSP